MIDGITETGKGNYIWLIDLGYGRIFYKRLTLGSQISIVGKKYFTNFEDNKYSDNGYWLVGCNILKDLSQIMIYTELL